MSGRANQAVTRFYWFTDASIGGARNLVTSGARSGGCDGLSEDLDDSVAGGQPACHASSRRRAEAGHPGQENNGWSLPDQQPRRLLENQDLCWQAEPGGLYRQRRSQGLSKADTVLNDGHQLTATIASRNVSTVNWPSSRPHTAATNGASKPDRWQTSRNIRAARTPSLTITILPCA